MLSSTTKASLRVSSDGYMRGFQLGLFLEFNEIFVSYPDDKLYIVMELVEGAPLGEHFSSLKEKKERFHEERIWHIFIQVVL